MGKGRIIPNGVSLEKHENDTVVFFTNLGYDIELIPPSNTPHAKRPDFTMGGVEWEMKSPSGKTAGTIEHAFRHAAVQSQNIVIDLRRTKLPDKTALNILKQRFEKSRRVRRLKIITKTSKLLDFNK